MLPGVVPFPPEFARRYREKGYWRDRTLAREFAAHSYGFRPGRGCKDALRRVERLLEAGYVHIVDADLKSYFDTIPKARLLALVGAKVSDGRLLALIEAFLEQGVRDGDREWTPEEGTPQGAVVSPLLSNIYLDPLDHLMAGCGFEMVRYADDFEARRKPPKPWSWCSNARRKPA